MGLHEENTVQLFGESHQVSFMVSLGEYTSAPGCHGK